MNTFHPSSLLSGLLMVLPLISVIKSTLMAAPGMIMTFGILCIPLLVIWQMGKDALVVKMATLGIFAALMHWQYCTEIIFNPYSAQIDAAITALWVGVFITDWIIAPKKKTPLTPVFLWVIVINAGIVYQVAALPDYTGISPLYILPALSTAMVYLTMAYAHDTRDMITLSYAILGNTIVLLLTYCCFIAIIMMDPSERAIAALTTYDYFPTHISKIILFFALPIVSNTLLGAYIFCRPQGNITEIMSERSLPSISQCILHMMNLRRKADKA